MSKEMPLKVFAKKFRFNPKEEQWILDNDKDTHYYNNSALPNAWSSLSYPIYDGDYYFAFIHKKARVNAQYNAKANRELRKYIKSTLNADEIFDKMEKYFEMQFKDAGSGDTMTREELWTAIVDARRKNPVKESFDVIDTYRDMMTEKVSYVEYKFKNKNDAQKAMNMLKSVNLMSFDITDDNLNGGELAVDACNKDMTKYHKQVMQKFKPKIQMSENYRKLAQYGMGTETSKSARVGLEMDFYDEKGNKQFGKILQKTNDGYLVKDDKGKKHKFKYHDRVKAKKMLKPNYVHTEKNEFSKNPLKGFPYNESLDEEVPEALRKQIERAVADVKRAQKFKSQASDRGDGRNALRRYQNKVWDAQDKLEALRDKAERLRG